MTEATGIFRALAELERRERSARRDAEALKINEYSLRGPRVEVEWFTDHHVRISLGRGDRWRQADYWPSTGRWRPSRRQHEESTRHGDFEDVRKWLEGGS